MKPNWKAGEAALAGWADGFKAGEAEGLREGEAKGLLRALRMVDEHWGKGTVTAAMLRLAARRLKAKRG